MDTGGAIWTPKGCGTYTLFVQQQKEEPPYDQTKMAVSAVDSRKISIVSTEVIPADTLFKTYNFLVWIDSTIVNASSKL
jgi:hypothetical protein